MIAEQLVDIKLSDLPGLDCGSCGYRTCEEFAVELMQDITLQKRCIHMSDNRMPANAQAPTQAKVAPLSIPTLAKEGLASCGSCASGCASLYSGELTFKDSLDRDFDFYLEHFPEDPGPREIIIPHNPMITRELDIQLGDVLIGRPLGMSCGCPITHCGIVVEVDHRTGVMTWCVTGPLQPRQQGYKDLGYYIAEGYEGIVQKTQSEIRIGARYFFQPRMCMLQWRHSGLVNYMNSTLDGWQIRLEGLWIG
ncbi:MAG: hypothetical protein CSYNP_04206 [Syntrophus sp. SKADARSKE-3]|nr:hypothetical protein [Syntrophus sp. SKADARSKE-3]